MQTFSFLVFSSWKKLYLKHTKFKSYLLKQAVWGDFKMLALQKLFYFKHMFGKIINKSIKITIFSLKSVYSTAYFNLRFVESFGWWFTEPNYFESFNLPFAILFKFNLSSCCKSV